MLISFSGALQHICIVWKLPHACTVQRRVESSYHTTVHKYGFRLCGLYTEFIYAQKTLLMLCRPQIFEHVLAMMAFCMYLMACLQYS